MRGAGSSTRLAIRSDENNDIFGVQARRRIAMRVVAPTEVFKRSSMETTSCRSVRAELEWSGCACLKMFETKMIMVAEHGDLAKEARALNRIVRWHPRK